MIRRTPPPFSLTLICLALAAASRSAPAEDPAAAEVRATVDAWRIAWEARDLDRYLSFYAPAFRSAGRDLRAWRDHKRGVFAAAGRIEVVIEGVEVEVDGQRARVRFGQRYRSRQLQDDGEKTLVLHRGGGGWRIVRESWIAEPLWPTRPIEGEPGLGREVEDAVSGWLEAWRAGDAGRLLGLYSARFAPEEGSLADWRSTRRALLADGAGVVLIEITGTRADLRGLAGRVEFFETLTARGQSRRGLRTLFLQREGDGTVRIVAEQWLPEDLWSGTGASSPDATTAPAPPPPPVVPWETERAPAPPPSPIDPPAPVPAEPPPVTTTTPPFSPRPGGSAEVAVGTPIETEPADPDGGAGFRQEYGLTYSYLSNAKLGDTRRGAGLRLGHGLGSRLAVIVDGSVHQGDEDRAFVLGGLEVALAATDAIRLYAHGLGGLVNLQGGDASATGFSLGGGFGLDLGRGRFGLRLAQVDLLQSFGLDDFYEDGRTYDVRVHGGLRFRIGGGAPPAR